MTRDQALAKFDKLVADRLAEDAEALRARGLDDSTIAQMIEAVRGHNIEQRSELAEWMRAAEAKTVTRSPRRLEGADPPQF